MCLLCWFDHFLDSRAEICQIFSFFFFGKSMTPERHSEINWSLKTQNPKENPEKKSWNQGWWKKRKISRELQENFPVNFVAKILAKPQKKEPIGRKNMSMKKVNCYVKIVLRHSKNKIYLGTVHKWCHQFFFRISFEMILIFWGEFFGNFQIGYHSVLE